nr:reverse transcriptase domain-containing protein [Tanacetum cinerariifolium]
MTLKSQTDFIYGRFDDIGKGNGAVGLKPRPESNQCTGPTVRFHYFYVGDDFEENSGENRDREKWKMKWKENTVKVTLKTPLSQPTSAVRNTLGREQASQNLVRPVPDEDLLEYCDKNYHQILPIISEKLHQEKVKQEKLKEVKVRLNFEEASQHSESETTNKRRNLRERLGPRGARTRSISPEQRRGRSKSPKEEGLETRTVFKILEKGVFHKLGDNEKNVSAHSRGSERKSYYSSRREAKSCYQSSSSKEIEISFEKHCYKREYSRRMEAESKSEGIARGHWKSKPKKQKSSMEDDLSQPWTKCIKDPVEIHNIKQRNGESTKEFVRRYKLECRDVKGAPECMKISGFMHGITNPELIKRLHDKIPQSMDEMMSVTSAFLRGEMAASNRERKSHFPHGSKKPDRSKTSRGKTSEMKKGWKTLAFDQGAKANNGKDQAKTAKKGETSRKDKPLAILMVQPWKRIARQRITQTFFSRSVIFFPTLKEEDWTEGPMIIEVEMGGHCVHRISLLVKIGDEEHSTSARMKAGEEGRKELCGLLRRRIDVFAWKPTDMTGVPRHIAEHMLNVREGCLPMRQKKIGQAPKRNKAINEELRKLVEAGIMKEVHYHSWLSNPVMVKKYDDSWRMCVNFKDLNKAFPKDGYLLPEIDWKVESLCGYPYKCFLDAYKGYHQIKMAKEDEKKTAFIISQRIFCYSKMPFGLKNVGATYQHLVDKAFQKHVGQNFEVYVDVLVIKSQIEEDGRHLLRNKVDENGLRVSPDKVKVVIDLPSPKCLKDVQKLNEKLASLNKFLSKSAEKSLPFFKTLKKLKGQILADFIVERPKDGRPDTPMEDREELPDPWILFMDGSSCVDVSGAGLIIMNPKGIEFTYALRFKFNATNNETEYEALIAGLRIASQMGIQNLQANMDSKLVANQVNRIYIANESSMVRYLEKVKNLASTFKGFSIKQIPRGEDKKADALSKITSTSFAHLSKQVLVEKLIEKAIDEKEVLAVVEEEGHTWMTSVYEYMTEGILPEKKKKARTVRRKAGRYAVISKVLYKKSFFGSWLRCIGPLQANYILREIHEWSCSMHAGPRSVVAKALRFELPGEVISDNKKQFRDNSFKDWCEKLNIRQCFTSVKHPQANALVKRANRSLGEGNKARLGGKNKSWVEEVSHVLWAHCTMINSSNREVLFSLTYGTKAVIPAEIGMPTLRTAEVDVNKNNEALEISLDLLEEKREQAAIQEAISKARMEGYYNAEFEAPVSVQETWSTKTMKRAIWKAKVSSNLSGRDHMKSQKCWAKEHTSLKTAMGLPFREHGTSATLENVTYMKCKHPFARKAKQKKKGTWISLCNIFKFLMKK